jgi:excinuclease ABC subunit C
VATLAERVEALPTGPGVYLFKSASGRILYVGKAQNLRARCRSYVGGGDGRFQVPKLVRRAVDVEAVVTPGVKAALLLENELIKKHKPPFNVRLRDDKQYLALRLDPKEEWPRLTQVRRFRRDGAWYFGPYTSSVSMRDALSNLRRIFPLRSCSKAVMRDYRRRGRPCIEYEMRRCVGPCCDLVDEPTYAGLVKGTALFLRGRSDELVDELRQQMQQAGEDERFEDAARLRDQIGAVERTVERQQIVAERPVDRDVFGIERQGGEIEVQVLHVRGGRVVGGQGYGFSDVRIDDGEVMTSFLGQYYGAADEREIPKEVLLPVPMQDDGALEALLAERAERRVRFHQPIRGALRELVSMAEANAEHGLRQRLLARESVEAALEELRDILGLAEIPRRIEGYDISTHYGTFAVGSRVTFEDGQPVKNDYRRYKVRDAEPGDDYACMREVLARRFAKLESEPLPDLIMIDGGKGQLGVAVAARDDAGLAVDVISLAKERDEDESRPGPARVRRSGGLKAERVFLPNRKDPIVMLPSSRALLALQRIRDESHRFAIEFQRVLRSKLNLTSVLEELPGIGPTKRRSLLRHLGSLRGVRSASEAELAAVPGVSARDAARLVRFFSAASGAEAQGAGDSAEPEEEMPIA